MPASTSLFLCITCYAVTVWLRVWHQVQADERPSRQPAELRELQGNVPRAQDRALTPPMPQGMRQQTVQVVALGVPVVQHMREPSHGISK